MRYKYLVITVQDNSKIYIECDFDHENYQKFRDLEREYDVTCKIKSYLPDTIVHRAQYSIDQYDEVVEFLNNKLGGTNGKQ